MSNKSHLSQRLKSCSHARNSDSVHRHRQILAVARFTLVVFDYARLQRRRNRRRDRQTSNVNVVETVLWLRLWLKRRTLSLSRAWKRSSATFFGHDGNGNDERCRCRVRGNTPLVGGTIRYVANMENGR